MINMHENMNFDPFSRTISSFFSRDHIFEQNDSNSPVLGFVFASLSEISEYRRPSFRATLQMKN